MRKGITIKDIARKAGVSTTAVSLALNGRPGVSSKTRAKIIKIAKRLNYQPNFAARALISRHSYTIGLILNNITDPFYPELAQGVEEQAHQLGYSLLLCNTNRDLDKEKQAIDVLRAKGVDGIILATVTKDDPNLAALVEDGFPFVLISRCSLEPSLENRVDYVVLDNMNGGRLGMEHLLRLGHERIAVITGDMNTSTAIFRLKGTRQALRAAGRKENPELVVAGDYRRDRAYQVTRELLGRERPPTAYFAHDDCMAMGVREALLEAGLRIPQDVALVGFDDTEMASITGVDLTTISQKKYKMGAVGTRVLIDRIEGNLRGMVSQVILEVRLVIRQSCGYHRHGYRNGEATA